MVIVPTKSLKNLPEDIKLKKSSPKVTAIKKNKPNTFSPSLLSITKNFAGLNTLAMYYNNNQNTAEQQRRTASERMAAQQQQAGDSQQHSWVEGEKRLKRELQKLVALQQQGQELGVPVLTRWLGEDIPAWAGTGVDRDAWQAQVEARYQEMRLDEERWRDRVAATLQQQAEKRG